MIYVIDDDVMWGEVVTRILADYEVRVFRDGVEAMGAMDERVPDMVILDMILDGPNGMTILHEMRSYEDLARVPVVVVSGVGVEGMGGREYGVVRVFDKGSLEPAELLRCVRELIG